MRQQDEPGRGLVVVELGQERRQNLLGRRRFVAPRKVGAVAPVLPVAEEKHLDAELARLLGDGEHVGVLDRVGVDALHALDGRERRETVAVARRALEFEVLRRRLHLGGEPVFHGVRLARQEGLRLPDEVWYSSSAISRVHGPEQRLI